MGAPEHGVFAALSHGGAAPAGCSNLMGQAGAVPCTVRSFSCVSRTVAGARGEGTHGGLVCG